MVVTTQLSVSVDNRRGALAELCSKLAEKAVNILGLLVPDAPGVAPIRLVVDTLDTAKKVFDVLGLQYAEEKVIAAHLSDRPGALGKLTRKLADHGIDVKYAYGSISKGGGKATVILAVSDIAAASKVVK